MLFANIIIDISHEKVDRPFGYIIPKQLEEQLQVGMSVRVPFGKGNTVRTGYIIEITAQASFDPLKMKEILGIAEDQSDANGLLIRLAAWMKRRYGSTMITALKTVIPARKKTKTLEKKQLIRLMTSAEVSSLEQICLQKHQVAKARVLHELIEEEVLPRELVTGKLHVSAATINALIKQGVIREEAYEYLRDPVKTADRTEQRVLLSTKQQQIVAAVCKDRTQGIHGTYLIHGITGSGKTEVYMALIEACIAEHKAAIVLIPEIALTYQTLMRFYKRFGNRVSVMNSTLSAGEKYDQCERARRGEIDVIIGPRSALFTPFAHLGLIIIDEEHEASYKSETTPKYHAKDVAIELA
ncbi:MAG: DEAD/DEAH box helicase family protein, partial [Lachnospiraceae bacterium]|nr:DEAD/DEAH box helicase family protein [Lachnospiraceae bacterium]